MGFNRRLSNIAMASGLSVDDSIDWKERIEKATANVGKCLDGFSVYEAQLIFDEAKKNFINTAVIHAAKD